MSQENLPWEKEESAEAHGTPQLPLHSLLHGKAHPDEVQPLSSVPPESDWDSLVSAQQRMVRKGRKKCDRARRVQLTSATVQEEAVDS